MQWRHDRWACTCSQVGSRLIDSMKCSQNPPAFIRRERVPFSCADAAFDYRRFDLRRAKNSLCRLMHSDSAVSSLALSVNINWSASFRLDWPSEIKATHCYPNTISSSEGCTSVDLLLRGKCFDLLHAIAVVCDRFRRYNHLEVTNYVQPEDRIASGAVAFSGTSLVFGGSLKFIGAATIFTDFGFCYVLINSKWNKAVHNQHPRGECIADGPPVGQDERETTSRRGPIH